MQGMGNLQIKRKLHLEKSTMTEQNRKHYMCVEGISRELVSVSAM
jgi:hypothetical protein